MSESQVAIVTGVSSGIGQAIAVSLVEQGFQVFGTVRSAAHQLPPGVRPLVLDVRDDASVKAAIEQVIAAAGRIDVVVNNAGAALVGAAEETELDQAQALLDVNFFGAVRVTHAALPHMRARGSGRIVFVSSVVGFLPAPFMGFYAASKHALEGYAESLDHEIRAFGIRVALVEPGFVRTNLDKNSVSAASPLDASAVARERAATSINSGVQAGANPAEIAKVVLRAITARTPKLRYPAGKGAGTLAMLRRLVPARTFDRSLRKQFHLDN